MTDPQDRRRIAALEHEVAILHELALAAEEFVWVCLQGNIGKRSDTEAAADLRDVVANYRAAYMKGEPA
jgi:hypothetical protein